MRLKLYLLETYPADIGLPNYATSSSAGFDLRSVERVVIKPNETKLVHLGIKSIIEKGYEVQLRSRSGLALKKSVFLMNGIGTIDADYRDEWGAIIHNAGSEDFVIDIGDRVAQAVVCALPKVDIERIRGDIGYEEDNDRKGGFGSTGIK